MIMNENTNQLLYKIEGNLESYCFCISYYRYTTPENIIEEIKHVWSSHASFFWPTPYSNIHPHQRYVC